MAGFAGALGGAGAQAAQYGQQIRGILEQRRGNFANLFSQLAQEETDPTLRAEYLGHATALLANKDMAKVVPAALKSLQKHVESNQQLAQTVGMPQQPKMGPAPAGPGQSPGTTVAPVSAAQPSSSPVQPQRQQEQNFTPVAGASQIQPVSSAPAPSSGAAPIPPVQAQAAPAPLIPGLPPGVSQPQGVQAIYQKWANHPLMQTPAGRKVLDPLIQQEVQHDQALMQTLEQQQTTLAYKKQALEQLKQSPVFHTLPPFVQAGYEAQVGGLSPVSMPQGSFVPTKYQSRAEELDPAVLAQFGLSNFKGPVTVSKSRLDGSVTDIVPGNEGLTLHTANDGTQTWVPKHEGTTTLLPSVVSAENAQKTLTLPDMTTGFQSPRQAAAGAAPTPTGGINPVGMSTQRTSSSEPTLSGGTVSSVETHKSFPGVAPGKSGVTITPPPSVGGSGSKPPANNPWASVRPFDESVPVDRIARMIAQDAANEKLISARGPFSAQNPSKAMIKSRMAQLGIDPNNIGQSIRDRASMANTLLPHMDELQSLIKQAQADGDLGVLATRFNELATGKVGVDPTKSKLFSKVASNLAFISSAIGITHGGVKGGSSLPMIEHWKSVLGAQDPNTLLSQLSVARKWIDGYAQMAGANKPVEGITPVTPPAGRKPLNEIFK